MVSPPWYPDTLDFLVIPIYPAVMDPDTLSLLSLQPAVTRWNDRLAFDVALLLEGSGETLHDVLERHHLDADDLLVYRADPVFLRRVGDYRNEVRDKGMTFKLKARAQAEELLTTSWLLIHDPAVSPTVKADLIKSTVKWAGLEPKEATPMESAGGVRITINLGNTPEDERVIDVPAPREPDPVQDLEMSE